MVLLFVVMVVYIRELMFLFFGIEMDVLGLNCGGNLLIGVIFIWMVRVMIWILLDIIVVNWYDFNLRL